LEILRGSTGKTGTVYKKGGSQIPKIIETFYSLCSRFRILSHLRLPGSGIVLVLLPSLYTKEGGKGSMRDTEVRSRRTVIMRNLY
jgi:hypothetical protein